MTKEQKLLNLLASKGILTINGVKASGLLPAAKRLKKKGKLRQGDTYFSISWTCPNEFKKVLARQKTNKERKSTEEQILMEIVLGSPRSQLLAKVMLGIYNEKPNSIGHYP